MTRILRAAVAVAGAVTLALVSPASAGGGKTFSAPFKAGPSGGDQWSYHSAGSDGTVTVGRVYPIPGVINCTKGGPYAKLMVPFHSTRPVRKIVVSYDSAALDNFTFLMVSLHDRHGHWWGTRTLRGLVAGSGQATLVPDRHPSSRSRSLVVEFGLQQSSACPNADFGTIHFDKVQIFS